MLSVLSYRLVLGFAYLLVRFVSLFHAKAARFVSGRRAIWSMLDGLGEKTAGEVRIWFHVSSLGEFEQARPLMEALTQRSCVRLYLSFFSPSGYELKKDYVLADRVFYLPWDTPRHAKRLFDALMPDMVLFVKYDFWYFVLREAHRRKIFCVSLGSVFREDQTFFKPYGAFFRRILHFFDLLLVQNEESQQLLAARGLRARVVGDTRADRVWQVAQAAYEDKQVEDFCSCREPVLMLGSLEFSDWHLCVSVLVCMSGYKYVFVPHELSARFMDEVVQSFPKGVVLRYSELTRETETKSCRALLIDDVGRLASMYRYADVAYVGGGRKGHLHNVLEPAAYGLPLVVGHHVKNRKFVELSPLARAGGLCVVRRRKELRVCLERWKDETQRRRAGKKNKDYLLAHRGSTRKIIDVLSKSHPALWQRMG